MLVHFNQTPQADVILRGYSGWNSSQALEVVDEVFPKVHSSVARNVKEMYLLF